ncbi:MAG TPA: NADH-quinone oxidoreductase subunit J [Acidobacteriota bacterium]|jgi:NADH-quinone oxidoreductase subunit J|nr:NADH-quinone oxidoreductase subunit J [Acidobacteriota bacterium]
MAFLFFYLFAAVALLSAFSVILQKKAMSSALSLIVCLGAIAMLYVQLEAIFIAVIQVIIYAGAIMVLFLFVIMLLDPASEKLAASLKGLAYIAAPLGILLAILFFQASLAYHPLALEASKAAPSDISSIGMQLFSNYLLPFEVTSILVLVAVMGAVVLAKKKL